MKSSIIASIIALSASAMASPLAVRQNDVHTLPVDLFTFSITNDVTGQSAASSVAINSAPKSFKDLFYPWATNLIRGDMILATSAMNLNSAVADVKCTIKGWGREMELSDRMTFTELDNAPGEAKETDVTVFTIQCVQ